MPTIPTYESQRRPAQRFGRVDQANPVVTHPDVYKGQAISNLGTATLKLVQRKQAEADKYEMEDKTTQLVGGMSDLKNNPQTGYATTKIGTAVTDKTYSEELERFEQLQGSLSEGLTADQKKMFRGKVNLARINYQLGLVDHLTREKEKLQGQVYTDGVSVSQQSAAENKDIAGQSEQSLDRIRELTEAEAARLKLSKDTKDRMLLENLSGGHASIIRAMVDDRQYDDARAWYAGAVEDGEITTDHAHSIDGLLNLAGEDARSIAFVDDMFPMFGEDRGAGDAYIRKNAPDADRDNIQNRYNNRLARDEQVTTEKQNRSQDQAYGTYMDGIKAGLSPQDAWDNVKPSIMKGMKGTHRAAMHNMMQADARGQAVHTDPAAFLDLYDIMTGTPEQKAKFRDKNQTNLRDQIGSLSTAHIVYFAGMQNDQVEFEYASTMADLKRAVGSAAGYYDKKTGAKKNADGIVEVIQRFDFELQQVQNKTKSKATMLEAMDIRDRLSIEYVRKHWYRKDEKFIAGAGAIEGVPAETIDELAAELQKQRAALKAAGHKSYRNPYGEIFSLEGKITEKEIQQFHWFKNEEEENEENEIDNWLDLGSAPAPKPRPKKDPVDPLQRLQLP